jgi:soluble lytic murein transglycosylase-like protein
MIKFKLITGLLLAILAFRIVNTNKITKIAKDPYLEVVDSVTIVNSAPSIQMYFYIKKYAAKYKIPEVYAFSLAYQETRYQGPLDLTYNHKQTSFVGALGPMQIMPSTAKLIEGRYISNIKLKNDIKLNVMISMKLLRKLYNIYGSWGVAFGAYNTGYPCINGYAHNILNKKYIWEM